MSMPRINPSAFNQISVSMDTLKRSAKSGHFAISQSGGEALLEAIHNMQEWVDSKGADLERLSREPGLGTSHGANTMKPYMASVAAGDQGFLPMLKKFTKSLSDAEQAIKSAMRNYGQLDDNAAGRF